jgi:hypothetical protein
LPVCTDTVCKQIAWKSQLENLEDINVDGKRILILSVRVGHGDVNCSCVEQNGKRVPLQSLQINSKQLAAKKGGIILSNLGNC